MIPKDRDLLREELTGPYVALYHRNAEFHSVIETLVNVISGLPDIAKEAERKEYARLDEIVRLEKGPY